MHHSYISATITVTVVLD